MPTASVLCERVVIGPRRILQNRSAAESPINQFQVGNVEYPSRPETIYLSCLGFLAFRWNGSRRKAIKRNSRSEYRKRPPPARRASSLWRSRKPSSQRESVGLPRQKSPESSS